MLIHELTKKASFLAIFILAFILSSCAQENISEDRNAGDVFKDCNEAYCPELVVVPAGSFMMGDIAGIGDVDEKPVHEVTFSQNFAVAKYTVTRGEYKLFIEETGHNMEGQCYGLDDIRDVNWLTPGFEQTDDHPAVCVSWLDADAYINWLNGKTGLNYRMLSEAEWEYTARAGTSTIYSHGNEEETLCEYANGADLAVDQWVEVEGDHWAKRNMNCNDGYGQTTSPVDQFKPNPFGLHDMTGNVWQWVRDCGNDGNLTYKNAPNDGSAHITGNCERMADRGGSWDDGPWNVRIANRGRNDVDTRYNALGFRLARDLSE